ncbi:hypothetical protein AURDEDRAFT_186521 [Auricularia subglabra TFB-10046 SS5]|nr:hypothetical protein AURDEDRAFT_186521 [Auricularia subglabra TFB-10046 SS5]
MTRYSGLELPARTTAALRQFVASNFEHPTWTPALGVWTSSDIARIKALRIPRTTVRRSEGHPDSVLYGLGQLEMLDPSFPGRLSDFTAGPDHLLLVNASGTGKTRLVLETLYQHWGLYFTAYRNSISDPYGSGDVALMLRQFIEQVLHERIPLPKKRNAQPPPELLKNKAIVANAVDDILFARLAVLDLFLKVVSDVGLSDTDARRKWFWLQVRPTDIVGLDVFDYAVGLFSALPRDEATHLLDRLLRDHSERFAFVAIDEAQALCHWQYQSAFARTDLRTSRPLMGELLVCLGSRLQRSRLIACGVEIDPDMFYDAVEESTSSIRTCRKFSSLGRFDDLEDVRHYMTHFLGDKLPARNVELAHRWFRGRHRFLAVLVHRTLIHGLEQFPSILDSILKVTTGLSREHASESRVNVNLGLVLEDDMLEESPLAELFWSATFANIAQRKPAVFAQHASRLVAIAAASFVDDGMDEARIDEPIILLNLVRWLRTSPRYSTAALIRQRINDSTTDLRGRGFAEAFALFLWRRFGVSGLRLTDLVSFPGSTPRWAIQTAPFALTRVNGGTRTVEPLTKLSGALVHAADHPDDVLAWFDRSSAPFLVPDSDFGPQLVFVLDALDGPRLVLLHLEPFPGRARPHRQDYVTPCVPARYYASRRVARTQFQAVLATFPTFALPQRKTARNIAYNTLQVYAFSEVQRSVDTERAPSATLRLSVILGEDSDSDREEDSVSERGEDKDSARWLELRADDVGSPIR